MSSIFRKKKSKKPKIITSLVLLTLLAFTIAAKTGHINFLENSGKNSKVHEVQLDLSQLKVDKSSENNL